MRFIRLLFLLPVVIALGLFLVSNTKNVIWHLWPLPYHLDVPAYVIPFLALAFGLVIGATIVWLKDRLG